MAAAALVADRRWCLTGTPIQVYWVIIWPEIKYVAFMYALLLEDIEEHSNIYYDKFELSLLCTLSLGAVEFFL